MKEEVKKQGGAVEREKGEMRVTGDCSAIDSASLFVAPEASFVQHEIGTTIKRQRG